MRIKKIRTLMRKKRGRESKGNGEKRKQEEGKRSDPI
jgi:hypothetical protein